MVAYLKNKLSVLKKILTVNKFVGLILNQIMDYNFVIIVSRLIDVLIHNSGLKKEQQNKLLGKNIIAIVSDYD